MGRWAGVMKTRVLNVLRDRAGRRGDPAVTRRGKAEAGKAGICLA